MLSHKLGRHPSKTRRANSGFFLMDRRCVPKDLGAWQATGGTIRHPCLPCPYRISNPCTHGREYRHVILVVIEMLIRRFGLSYMMMRKAAFYQRLSMRPKTCSHRKIHHVGRRLPSPAPPSLTRTGGRPSKSLIPIFLSVSMSGIAPIGCLSPLLPTGFPSPPGDGRLFRRWLPGAWRSLFTAISRLGLTCGAGDLGHLLRSRALTSRLGRPLCFG